MSQYVRARGAYRFNNGQHSIAAQSGDLFPATHWAVRSCTDPTWFEPADLDADTAEQVDALFAVRGELGDILRRHPGPREAWRAGVEQNFNEVQRRESQHLEALRASQTDRARRLDEVRSRARAGAVEAGHEQSGTRRSQPVGIIEQARRLVDQEHRSATIPDYAAERVEDLLMRSKPAEAAYTARWALCTGRAAYRSAFAALVADPVRGHLRWTPEEGEAFRAAQAFYDETRALAIGTDSAGGFLVPFQLDPAVLLTSAGSVNPLRRIARVEQIASDAWHGVTSAGATAEWKAEAAEVADASPSFAQPSVPVHFGDAFTPYSFEVGQDAVDLLGQLALILRDAADQLQVQAFWKGTGSGQPTGLLTSLPAGSKVASTAADAVVAGDFVKVQNSLKPRWQGNAQWCANLTTINDLGSLETTNGALRFPEVSDGRLLRRPLNEASPLDAAGATASAGNDFVAVYGDFSQFLIVDRIGTSIELIPQLFGANRRPTGQRGAFLWFRTGSARLIDDAFRVLTA